MIGQTPSARRFGHGLLLATLTAAFGGLPGCSGAGSMSSLASSSAMQEMAGKLFGNWDLSQLAGKDIAGLLPAGSRTPSLKFSPDGSVSGFSGVNNLTTSLDTKALATGNLKLAPAASTKMAGSRQATGVENEFLALLSRVTGYQIDGDTLSLKNGTETLMKFARGT